MTTNEARSWLIVASLISCGSTFAFLVIAPVIGYPLSYPQAFRIIQIIFPVFVGYLGSSARFVFRQPPKNDIELEADNPLIKLLIKGPLYVFAGLIIVLLFGFGFSNRQSATQGTGMSVDALATFIATILGILAATTGYAVSYLFSLHVDGSKVEQR